MQITTARENKVIAVSNFDGYDFCINPYVGCEHSCSFCYVRFFLRDVLPWGKWIRIREHMSKRLPKDLVKIKSSRIVIGTMCDPYQPLEEKYRITRTILQILASTNPQMEKVGIFTRSPIVLQDLELIKQLPDARIHYTISPIPDESDWLERPVITIAEQFETAKLIKQSGVGLCLNIAPAFPGISDNLIERFAKIIAELQPIEFFVDSFQPYKEAVNALRQFSRNSLTWQTIEKIIGDKITYFKWKQNFYQEWKKAWKKFHTFAPNTTPLFYDHETKIRVNLNIEESLPSARGEKA